MKSIIFLVLAASASQLIAAETSSVAAPGAKAGQAPYVLQKHSSFQVAAGFRPPFWPIGWVKRERGSVANTPAAPKFVFDARGFALTSILLGPPAIAVINGRAYEEGQLVRMARLGVPVAATPGGAAAAAPRIRVHRIADGEVWLQCEGQLVNVSMKRPELSERRVTEEVLNSDRDEDAPLPAVSAR